MANISQELAAIMAAVFGRDVRQSIHDAIDKINKVSEVQMNTGTAITSASSSSEGFYDGSLYINTSSYELWKCIGTNTWQSLGILRGTDGRAISSISGPATVGLVDTYTINYSDGTTSTFSVTNGADGVDGKDGSVWYRGTAFTTTGSGLTGYPGNEHDFYLNPTLGYVYQCTRTGDATTALWEYAMAITGGSGGSIVVIDNLTNSSTTDALSANQGRNLNNKKIEKPATASNGQLLGYDGSDWIAVNPPEGHPMVPDPTSTAPASAAAQEAAIVTAINAGRTEGWSNDDVASHNSIAHWSNTMSKTYRVSGTASNSPIGTTGIGEWYDGDIEDFDPSTDETGWISIPELDGISSNGNVDFKLVFDPATTSIPIVLGGYIIDDVNGKMCIKFANEIAEEDTETAVVGIEMIYKRTDTVDVSFS